MHSTNRTFIQQVLFKCQPLFYETKRSIKQTRQETSAWWGRQTRTGKTAQCAVHSHKPRASQEQHSSSEVRETFPGKGPVHLDLEDELVKQRGNEEKELHEETSPGSSLKSRERWQIG